MMVLTVTFENKTCEKVKTGLKGSSDFNTLASMHKKAYRKAIIGLWEKKGAKALWTFLTLTIIHCKGYLFG